MSERQRPTPQDYADLFETDKRGARILEDLILRFVRPPVTDGGIDAVLKTYERLGQRKPIDYIATMINRAAGIEPSDEQKE
jgi:hypothetical protein